MASIENHELVDIIRRKQGDRTLRDFAKAIQFQPTYLSEVLNGVRPVGGRLALAMGYKRVKTTRIMFKRKSEK